MNLYEQPMDTATNFWRASHDSEYRSKVLKIAAIGHQWSERLAHELLDACESLGPSEIYYMIESSPPSSYVIAALILLAKEAQKTQSAKSLASRRHKENHAMKADVFKWLDINREDYKSMDAAALAITKQQPIAFRTARDWAGEWKKLRSAGTT